MVVHIYDTAVSPPSNKLFRDVLAMAELARIMLHDALDALARVSAPSREWTTGCALPTCSIEFFC